MKLHGNSFAVELFKYKGSRRTGPVGNGQMVKKLVEKAENQL